MECLRRRDHNVSFFNLEGDINAYLKEQGQEQRTVLTSANYEASLASITRSMIMSSKIHPYRERARGEVVARHKNNVSLYMKKHKLYENTRQRAINYLRTMHFTQTIK